MNISNAMIGAL